MLTSRDYDEALGSQYACNAIALVNSLAEVMPRIKDACGGITIDMNQHSIMILYITQLAYLSGGYLDHPKYSQAYEKCVTERNRLLAKELNNT